MMKKIIRLNEKEMENLINKIIREDKKDLDESVEDTLLSMIVENVIKEEDEGVNDEKMDNPRDVSKFLELADKYLFKKFTKYAEKINTTKEKAGLIAALAKKWGVDTAELAKVKSILSKENISPEEATITEWNPFKKKGDNNQNKDFTKDGLFSFMKKKYGITNSQININLGRPQFKKMVDSILSGNDHNDGNSFKTTIGKAANELHDIMKLDESRLEEAGGYDDPNIMGKHAGHVIGTIREVLKGVVLGMTGLDSLIGKGQKGEIMGNVEHLTELIEESIELLSKSISDFTEDDLIADTKRLVGSLKRYNRKLRVLGSMGHGYDEVDFDRALLDTSNELTQGITKYIKTLRTVDQRFTKRFTGQDRGEYGKGNDYLNN